MVNEARDPKGEYRNALTVKYREARQNIIGVIG